MGSGKFPDLAAIMQGIVRVIAYEAAELFSTYLQGNTNILADWLSRADDAANPIIGELILTKCVDAVWDEWKLSRGFPGSDVILLNGKSEIRSVLDAIESPYWKQGGKIAIIIPKSSAWIFAKFIKKNLRYLSVEVYLLLDEPCPALICGGLTETRMGPITCYSKKLNGEKGEGK